MRLRRRALLPENGPEASGCWFSCSPPPVVPSTYNPGVAPSPWPYGSPPPGPTPCPQVSTPPAPAPANSGRRNQGGGMPGYGVPPAGGGGGDDNHRHLVTSVLIAAGVIAFVSLILLGVSVAVRRRQVRRRRQALLAPAAPAGGPNGGGDDDPEGGGGGGGGVVHHIWYIRTVGLDEAEINSIAVTQYRAGAGLLGAADCSVCLGEFQDGELVRLLPKCGHAFHVPCIDTWLRAHVNCPLCRSDVLDPASGGGAETESSAGPSTNTAPADDPDANANDAAGQATAASDAYPDQDQEGEEEEESDGRGASSTEEEERQEQSSSSASPEPPLPRNVRRAASMDAALVSTAADVAAALDRLPEAGPEEEEQQIGGRRKRGTGQRGGLSTTDRPASVGVPRSFFSRHCRARSSVLPLGLD